MNCDYCRSVLVPGVNCGCAADETIRTLRARVEELEAEHDKLVLQFDMVACTNIELQARVAELTAEREARLVDAALALGESRVKRIAELEQLVSLLKRDAADGTADQHYMDGAEAALEWAAEEMLRRDTEIRSFIQRGLDAVGGLK